MNITWLYLLYMLSLCKLLHHKSSRCKMYNFEGRHLDTIWMKMPHKIINHEICCCLVQYLIKIFCLHLISIKITETKLHTWIPLRMQLWNVGDGQVASTICTSLGYRWWYSMDIHVLTFGIWSQAKRLYLIHFYFTSIYLRNQRILWTQDYIAVYKWDVNKVFPS